MALPGALLVLPLTLHLQSGFGQQLSAGIVELSKLPVHKDKDTNALSLAKYFDTIMKIQKIGNDENEKTNTYYNFNKTETKANDEAMMANVQFLRNQIPAITSTMVNGNALGSQTLFGSSINSYLGSNTNQVKAATTTGETILKQTESETLTEPKSLLHVPNLASLSFVTSPQTVYLASAQPAPSSGSFIPSTVSFHTVAAPSQNQAAHQTPSKLLIQPSNMQSPVSYMNAVPRNVSTQNTMGIVQNGQSLTSLLLSHVLSPSYKTQDPPSPIQTSYVSRDQQQLNNNTLLPLLRVLEFLKEKNKSDCKSRKSRIHNNGLKRLKLINGFETASPEEFNSESDTSEHIDRGVVEGHSARDSGVENDDYSHYYSDESSDYSTENYDED